MKFIKTLAAIVLCISAVCSAALFSACKKDSGIKVYAPDGAPALAIAKLMAEENDFGEGVSYEVVNSSLIYTYVTGKSPDADVCILPVNQAAQLLGDGKTYKMLGTVTHGNLYMLGKVEDGQESDAIINSNNLSSLIGKSVGIINLAAVPGLTFKLILNEAGIAYNQVGNDGKLSDTAVNLFSINAAQIGTMDYDYYIAAEPAATAKVNSIDGLEFVGSLQDLYGEGGYPQAVVVAKSSLIENNPAFIKDFTAELTAAAQWLKDEDVTAQTIADAVKSHLTEGMTPTFTAANLSAQVIDNCAISFAPAQDCKAEVVSFLEKLGKVESKSYTVAEEFFYAA